MEPLQHFLQAKRDLEKLHNDYATKLRQEYNQFNAQIKQILNGLDDQIEEKVKQQLELHMAQIHNAIQTTAEKVDKHFGS